MYRIFLSKDFIKAAHRLERSGKFTKEEVNEVLELLASGKSLHARFRDHLLRGDMQGKRECHIRGDILLIYRKDHDALLLVALEIGPHHELFGL